MHSGRCNRNRATDFQCMIQPSRPQSKGRTPTVQVSLTLQQAAVVAITVSAYSLFTPQPYALAVIGNFTGTLASESNPAYSSAGGGGGASAACSDPVTTISAAPPRYTNATTVSFAFAADSSTPCF